MTAATLDVEARIAADPAARSVSKPMASRCPR
jgi:hypothetical protein